LKRKRYVNASDAEVDYIHPSLRAQYISPDNDQGFSPFFSYVTRIDFQTTFAREFATRQDLNLGVDKVFNFDGEFNRIPAASNSSASTVWSFGFSAGAQWRFRNPPPQSGAPFLNLSAAYIISEHWNLSFYMPTTRRWYVSINGVSRKDWTVEPTAILEYIIPIGWFGGADTARLLGRPALDSVVSLEKDWSNESGGTYGQWIAGLVLKGGWRF
jgi:hypothetical protein